METASPWIVEANEQNFANLVMSRLREKPILVDFWAPWCGPCKTLGPILEKLAAEMNGRFVLVKINSDENPNLARKFGVRGIPTVKLLIHGQIVDEFTGAQPESAIRKFIDKGIPSEADELAVQARMLEEQGDEIGAARYYRAALEHAPQHYASLIGIARLMAMDGHHQEAETVLERLTPEDAQRPETRQLQAQLAMFRNGGGGNTDELRQKVDAHPEDLEARLTLGQALTAAGYHAEGMEQFLEVVRRDRKFQEDAGRKAMLQVFDMLGPADALVMEYRSRLSALLFS